MLTSLISREMQIKTTMRLSPQLEWLVSKRQETTSVGEKVDKKQITVHGC